mgnify:FL=1
MKVVIFDMDGTVIDSGEAIYKTVNEVRDELNLPPLEKEFIIKAINEPGRNLALEFYGIDTPSKSLKEGFEEKFKKFYDECATTYEGVKELLQKCKEAKFKIVLASNAPHDTLEKILKKNEIDYFKVANLVFDDFRKVKLGRITLETVEDIEKFEEDNGN